MSKFSETKTKPNYFLRAQRAVNKFPSWAKPRTDKHSNYQSILSDLIAPIIETMEKGQQYSKRQSVTETDTSESATIYSYNFDVPLVQQETVSYYQDPISVVVSSSDPVVNELPLVKVKAGNLSELNERLPVAVKQLINKNSPYNIVSYDPVEKEYLIFVNRTCYLGFRILIPSIKPEDFYIKQGNEYNYPAAYVNGLFNGNTHSMYIFATRDHCFQNPLTPGLHYLKFELMDESLFDPGTDIEIVANNAFGSDEKMFYFEQYFSDTKVSHSYIQIRDQFRLEIVNKDVTTESGDYASSDILESYMLLNEESEGIEMISFLKKENMLYVLDNTSPTKLHLYNLYLDGNDFLYEDNALYLYDLVCDKIDYRPGDSISVETRRTGSISAYEIQSLRLKIENSSDIGNPFYIDRAGNIVDGEAAWFDATMYESRWIFNLPEDLLGSYKLTLESYIAGQSLTAFIIGVKLLNINYKAPYKTFELDSQYVGWELGIDPNGQVSLVESATGEVKEISFYKDGYFFDSDSGIIYTNYPFENLVVEY